MNRKIVLLNVLLAALLLWLGVQLRARWVESKAREAAAMARAPQPTPPAAPPPADPVEPAQAANYLDVAQHMLFSPDRDSNVIIDAAPPPPPPPPPPPEPPVPPLPQYHGQMSFGEPVIVLSTEKTPQKSYRVGDKVGEFTLAAFDGETVTLQWNEKTLHSELKNIAAKEPDRPVQSSASPKAAPVAAVAKMGGAPAQPRSDPVFGPQNGMYRSCVESDTSPDGTVKDGYRKVIVQSLMGRTCQWEPIR